MLRLPLSIFPLLIFATALTGCGNKSDQNPTQMDTTETPLAVEQGPGQDDKRVLRDTLSLGQHQYRYVVTREANDSLPLVKDRFGDPYQDNCVTLVIDRDGASWLTTSFTKENFATAAPVGARLEQMILGGMAFNKATAAGFVFGAILNVPGDEEGGLAFKVTIPLSGEGAARIEYDPTSEDNTYAVTE